jgi:hypothetical protein
MPLKASSQSLLDIGCGAARRGAFSGIVDLQAAIKRYLKEHNADPSPSSGPSPLLKSSINSLGSLHLLTESVR